ncbi:DUF1735 domain-containing protein [Sphingobacterium daejeonense]|uniref:DUF1735 domain-containing protein n=1 Tax=Sphingobacterium daejeonense TaxID=371142 RepID=UPI0021A3FDBC|nr:DUF1735 domain-containing protein [Sphingobacterium daejeonense]MCT1529698.1 DUF1735 domain-containing protein [Sphingobacterium daejeonense]
MKTMFKLFKYIYIPILCCLTLISCKDTALEDFSIKPGSATTVGSGDIAGGITKTNEQVTVPVSIKLSTPATKAFDVNLAVNQKAAADHIKSKNLGSNYIAVKAESIYLPNSAKVNFGADSTVFTLTITRTEIEKYFGKNVVIGYDITNAGKGNAIDKNNATGVIILKVNDLITESDIHFLSLINGAGMVLEAKNQVNYESSSSGLTIPIGITLASFPGSAFTVDVATRTDTIAKLISSGVLPANTVALTPEQYTITNKVQFASNAKTSSLELTVPWSVINQNLDKKLAVMVELTNSTLHVINPTKNYSILLIDSENVVEVDVTNDAVFSVSRDNTSNANENSPKLIDGNYNSKFLLGDFVDLEAKLVYTEAQKIGAYTLTSGNDAPERDPAEWVLYGSNDGTIWEALDTRRTEVFNARNETKRFNIEFPKAYKQFKLHIERTRSSSLFQMSEWRMVRIP